MIELMIFLALVYIAYHLPTEDQLNVVIRLLKKGQEEVNDLGAENQAVHSPRPGSQPTKTPPTNTPDAKTAGKPTVDRRKR